MSDAASGKRGERPIAEALHAWMIAQRLKAPGGLATAKALD